MVIGAAPAERWRTGRSPALWIGSADARQDFPARAARPAMFPEIGGTGQAHRRQPRVDPVQAIVADHDRLSRSVQGPADEIAKITISLPHGACLSHRSAAVTASTFPPRPKPHRNSG